MDHLLSASLVMASHYPLAHTDLLHYPDSHIIHLDMDHTAHPDFTSKHHQQLVPPAAEYTSSPSIDSQTDDDPADRVFDVEVDYIHLHTPQQPQLTSYDPVDSPVWDPMATPRAWEGAPQKLPSLDPESRRVSFGPYATAVSGVVHHSTAASHLYGTLADYLDQSAAAPSTSATHSPPTTYMSEPASLGGMDYYPTSPYRYNTSLQHNPGCDPRFVSPGPSVAGPSSSPQRQEVGISFADVYTDPMQTPTQTQTEAHVKVEPDTLMSTYDSDSGEDEKSESDDPSYVISTRSTRSRSDSNTIAPPRPMRTAAPEPVPNLTKKSRGRRVPTAAALYGSPSAFASGSKNARTYVCKVRDCGKCFARSEHLKRHVRSIHTNEKPHRCLHPGCNKEFSRHDNLCQHMRVHRNYSAPKDGAFGTF